jgi:uncharacterized protein
VNYLEQTTQRIYEVGIRRWRAVTMCIAALVVVGTLFMTQVPLREDISVMLPDSDPAFIRSYQLLDAAPFTRNIVIDLEAQDAEQVALLTETAERLSERLGPPYISGVIGGMSAEAGAGLLDWLYAHSPQLFTENDAAALVAKVAPDQVAASLQSSLQALTGPEGVWVRRWLARDPLGFRNQVFRKLGAVAMLPDVRIEGGFLMDPNGRHVLLVAQTPVSMGDSQAGRQLLDYLNGVISQTVPSTIRAHVVCAHRYTVANADTIKKDLVVVFVASSIAMIAIFVSLLRHWRVLFVFAVPCLAVFAAVLLTAVVFRRLSAITVGFGAVLLGIADDFGLHVYYTLRQQPRDPAQAVAHLAVPEVVSWATTVGVFVVLLWSGIPIQRQLAIFSTIGLTVALGLAFLWLPHWVMGGRPNRTLTLPAMNRPRPCWTIGVWSLLTLALLPICWQVQFDGDLRKVGVVPQDVLADEHTIRDVWADPRGRALAIIRTGDMESRLRANEQVYATLSQRWGLGELVSLAPLLPSHATQLANIARWRQFWKEQGRLEQLREALNAQGAKLHFAAGTFEPFIQSLEKDPEPFGVEDLRQAAGPLLDTLFIQQPTDVGLISLLPDNEQLTEAFGTANQNLPPGVELVSQKQFASVLRNTLEGDFRRFILLAMITVVFVTTAILRRGSQVVLSLLPALTGLEVMLATMVLLGLKVNLFNVAASVLVLGLSIDYGVFMACVGHERNRATDLALFTSALTTVSGFGVLALAHHPALFSLGITVVLGIIPAMISALIVVPAFQSRRHAN